MTELSPSPARNDQEGSIPGMTKPGLRRPNLFIIGAMKSGTSTLHAILGTHPSIYMAKVKEPSHFVEPSQLKVLWPLMEQRGYCHSVDRYLTLFEEAGEAAFVGESSTAYTKLPRITGVAERIKAFNPEARLIYIMRDPVERAISQYWHRVRALYEKQDMLEAFRSDPTYRDYSNYAMQLQPYVSLFSADRIKAVTFERMKEDPAALAQEIFRWLGVDDTFVPPNTDDPQNVTPAYIEKGRGRGLLNRVRRSRLWDQARPYFPSTVRSLGKRMAMEAVNRRSVPTEQAVAYLRDIQRREVETLGQMLGRRFPEWTTLYQR